MNENQERKAFEAWVLEGDKDAALDLHFMECGRYAINRIQWAWSAWQARAALATKAEAKPLTLDEIIKLAAIEFPSRQWQSVEHLVRAVERAHGIGASTKEGGK